MVSWCWYVWPKVTVELSEAELEIEMSSVVEVLELVEVLSVSELKLVKESSFLAHEMIVRLTK